MRAVLLSVTPLLSMFFFFSPSAMRLIQKDPLRPARLPPLAYIGGAPPFCFPSHFGLAILSDFS